MVYISSILYWRNTLIFEYSWWSNTNDNNIKWKVTIAPADVIPPIAEGRHRLCVLNAPSSSAFSAPFYMHSKMWERGTIWSNYSRESKWLRETATNYSEGSDNSSPKVSDKVKSIKNNTTANFIHKNSSNNSIR